MTVVGWCLPDEQHKKASVTTDTGPAAPEHIICRRTGSTYRVGEQLARTGRSTVYAVESDSAPLAFKRYAPGTLQDEPHLEARIRAMVSRPPAYRAADTTHIWCAWPEDLAIVENQLAGYVMPRIDVADAVTLPDPVHGGDPTRRQKEGGRGVRTWAERVLVAADLARTVALLHDSEVIVGDLPGQHVVIAADRRVTLLGCDSMQVTDRARGRTYPCRSDRDRLVPPELLVASGITMLRPRSADLFSLAVALHLVLLDGEHPFDGEWRGHGAMPPAERLAQSGLWCHAGDERLRPHPHGTPLSVLPDVLQQYFKMAFVDGARHPYDRPSAREWQVELDRLHNSLSGPAWSPTRVVPVRVASAAPPRPLVRRPTTLVHRPSPVGSPDSTLRDVEPPTGDAVLTPVARAVATDEGSAPREVRISTPRRRGRPALLRLGAWTAVVALCAGGVGTASALQGIAAGPSTSSVTASTRAASPSTSPTARPDGPAQVLQAIHEQDASDAEGLTDSWVAQLATQPVVPSAGDAALSAILAGHRAVQRRYPTALLLWSADWNYDGSSWITVLGRRFATAGEANAWCDAQRLQPRRCFAKRLSHTGPVDGSVRYRG